MPSKTSTFKISAPSRERSTTQRPHRLIASLALEFSSSSLLPLPHRLGIAALASQRPPASPLVPWPCLHTDTIMTLTSHGQPCTSLPSALPTPLYLWEKV